MQPRRLPPIGRPLRLPLALMMFAILGAPPAGAAGTPPVRAVASVGAWRGSEYLPRFALPSASSESERAAEPGAAETLGPPPATRPDEGEWFTGLGLPIPDGPVYALTTYRGELIAAGAFTEIAGRPAAHIARWDGTAWQPLGQGTNSDVFALLVQDDRLVVAGAFGYAGGVWTGPVAEWDGSRWIGLPGPRLAWVAYALTLHQGALVVAGDLSDSRGGLGVFRLGDAGWEQLGSGFDGSIHALASDGTTLYAGGAFDHRDSTEVGHLVGWDGSSWSPVGGGITDAEGRDVMALTMHQGRLIAGGVFSGAGGISAPLVAAWDGAAWDSLAGFPYSGGGWVGNLYSTGDSLWAVGPFQKPGEWASSLAILAGGVWSLAPEPLDWGLRAITSYDGAITVAGDRVAPFAPGGIPQPPLGVARLENGHWRSLLPVEPGMRGLTGAWQTGVSALAPFQGDLVAAGNIQFAGAPPGWAAVGPVARWNGANWTDMSQNMRGVVTALRDWNGTLVAAGIFQIWPTQDGVARWDGQAWQPWDPLGGAVVVQATAMAIHQGRLVVAGLRGPGDWVVAAWTGSSWEVIGTVEPSQSPAYSVPTVSAMTSHAGALVIGGSFTAVNGVAASGLASWDGVGWSAVGGSLYGRVEALASYRGDLWVGGDGAIGTDAPLPLARWDGQGWHPVSILGSQNRVMAIGHLGTDLVVAGSFRRVEGSTATDIALYDGDAWSALGSGLESRGVTALASVGGSLWAGGWISRAGGRSSFGVARWDPPGPPGSTPLAFAPPAPNPFAEQLTFSFVLRRDAHVRLTLLDLAGRRVARVLDEDRLAGPNTFTWTPSASRVRMRPGVYVARLEMAGGASASRRVVYLP